MPMFVDFARAFFPSNQIDFDFPTSFYGASSQTLSEEPPSINNIQVLSSMHSKYIKRKSSPATCNHYAALLTSACLDLMSRFWSLLIRFFREIRGSCWFLYQFLQGGSREEFSRVSGRCDDVERRKPNRQDPDPPRLTSSCR